MITRERARIKGVVSLSKRSRINDTPLYNPRGISSSFTGYVVVDTGIMLRLNNDAYPSRRDDESVYRSSPGQRYGRGNTMMSDRSVNCSGLIHGRMNTLRAYRPAGVISLC